jgi:Na+/proline symporter
MLGLHWVDIVAIIAYLLFMAGIGVFAYLRVKDQGDYFRLSSWTAPLLFSETLFIEGTSAGGR